MQVSRAIRELIQYFSDAIVRIFGLNDDAYPNTGVQPFEGDPASKS